MRATPSTNSSTVRRAGRCDPRSEGPQAAASLHGRWLHGRTLRRGGRWQVHPHDRRRVRGCGGRGPAVRELGLGGYTNTSYTRGLAALIDDEPERYAVIDAGTNSIKFHIGERDLEGSWRTVVDRAELTRLGEGLAQQGVIIDAALERTVAAIAGMVDEAKRTACAHRRRGHRRPSDRQERQGSRRCHPRRTGVHIEVISGEDEGRLAYLAAKAGLGVGHGLARRVRHRWRQFAVHLRARLQRGRAFQRRRRRRGLHRALPARPRVSPGVRRKPWRRYRPACRASTGVRSPMRSWRWEAR